MYHSVGGQALGDRRGIFSVSPVGFRKHINFISNMQNCQAVPLSPISISERDLQLAVTLDDGYQDNLRIAGPVLVEHGIPFTVFVCSDFVKNRVKGFVSPEELKELAGLPGASIGAHGKSHRRLTECNDGDLEDELRSCKLYIEDVLSRSVTAIAYPYGAANIRVRDEALRVGYEVGVCTQFDINIPGRDPLLLCRCNIERDDSASIVNEKIRGEWDWYRWCSKDPLLTA